MKQGKLSFDFFFSTSQLWKKFCLFFMEKVQNSPFSLFFLTLFLGKKQAAFMPFIPHLCGSCSTLVSRLLHTCVEYAPHLCGLNTLFQRITPTILHNDNTRFLILQLLREITSQELRNFLKPDSQLLSTDISHRRPIVLNQIINEKRLALNE